MSKKLNYEQWKEIGDKIKETRANLYEIFDLLSSKLSEKDYYKDWKKAEEAFGNMRNNLDELAHVQLPEIDDTTFCEILYGQKKD